MGFKTDDELKINRGFKRVRDSLKKKKKNIPEFKFTRSDDTARKKVLKGLVKTEYRAGDIPRYSIVLLRQLDGVR